MGNNGNSKPKQATLDKTQSGVPASYQRPEYRALGADKDSVDNFVQTLKNNLANESLTVRDLTKITVPAQGYEVWSLPLNPEKPDDNRYPPTIEGIIVTVQTPRAWWPLSFEEMGRTPPTCSSLDSITGFGSPDGNQPKAHDCMTCAHNQWGSSNRGSGKACREQRLLFMIRPDDMLPIVVQVPVTSIEPWRKYCVNLSLGPQLPYWHTYTRLALTKVEGDGVPYSVIVPTMAGAVDPELRPRLDHYVSKLNEIIEQTSYIPDPPHPALQGDTGASDDPPAEEQDITVVDHVPADDNAAGEGAQEQGEEEDRVPVAADNLPNVDF